MSLVEFAAVEQFAHALAEPLTADDDGLVAVIEAKTATLSAAVDKVLARFAPRGGEGEAALAARLKVVEGLVAMLSSGITDYAAGCREVADPIIRTAMHDAHDAMVADYYRLLCLKADLDPESHGPGPELKSPRDIKAWFARALA